jgi:SAM-dependent methyltransferase
MVFKEHLGSGRDAGRDVRTMESRWDTHWLREDVLLEVQQSKNWQWIKKYIFPPGRILEAGCGLAKWVKFFEEQGFEAYGLDFSKVAIEASLSKWPGLRLVCGDLRKMPYEDGFFKAIVSFGAIEHDEQGPEAALHEIYRVLARNGILYCTVPCINHIRRLGSLAIKDWIVCNNTIRRLTGRKPDATFFEYVWTPKEYAEILTQAGFELIDLVPLEPSSIFGPAKSIRRRVIEPIHRRFPWLLTHMMAGICRKP